MQVTANYNTPQKVFGHGHRQKNNHYTPAQKAIIATTTALGVATSCACLAKGAGYSLKPSKMFKNFKNSWFWKTDFLAKEVISIGAGTCLGGLAGGYLVDKNPHNRKAKQREAVMQMGNISIPILTVAGFDKITKKHGKFAKAAGMLAGVFVGVNIANFLMNKLSNQLFHNKDERGVKLIDFSAHVDDILAGASYASESETVHKIARIVPAILVLPGFEVGTKVKE